MREAIDGCLAAGLSSIGVWREQLAEAGQENAVRWLTDAGLRVSTLCRGGFFTASDPAAIEAAHAENIRALDEAAAIGAATLCLVPGGLPAGDRDLPAARRRAAEAIEKLVPYAQQVGVSLGIEPMNPIYAADRGVVSTLGQALDIAEPYAVDEVGIVLDTFHVWWDPDLQAQIARAGDRIHSYQVCDWITPLPADALLARGMMGDGAHRLRDHRIVGGRAPATPATSRSRSSTPTSGPPPATRCWPPCRRATWSSSSRTPDPARTRLLSSSAQRFR